MSIETDTWDDLKDLGKTPSLTPVSTDSGSGEYNPFAYVGAVSAGGTKRTLFHVGDAVEPKCCGLVSSAKFCLKDAKACLVKSHEVNKFTPSENEAYVRGSNVQGLTTLFWPLESLTVYQREILLSKRFTNSEWEHLIDEFNSGGDLPSWLEDNDYAPAPAKAPCKPEITIEVPTDSETSFPPLLSPLQTEGWEGIFKEAPVLSTLGADESFTESDDEKIMGKTVQVLQAHAEEVITKWASTFRDVESSYMLLIEDLRRLHNATQTIHKRVGGGGEDSKSLTTIIGATQASVLELQHLNASRFERMSSELTALSQDVSASNTGVDQLKAELGTIAARVAATEERNVAFGKRFENIRPLVAKVRELSLAHQQSGAVDVSAMDQKLSALNSRLDQMQRSLERAIDNSWEMSEHPGGLTSQSMTDILARLKSLEQRVVGDGVSLGNTVFQSFDDLRTWVTSSLPKYRYGLFVDAGGLLDLFSFMGFTDFEKTTAAMSNIQKSGFATMYEARLASSMQNLFPTVFGKPAADGLDSSEYLPGVTEPDRWDNGHTGLYHQLTRSLIDVEFQLESTIDTVFGDFPAARLLAKDCLYQSKRFITDFCTFVTRELKAWIHRGFSKKEAWRVVCTCIRRIFEELHSARVCARDVRDMADPAFTAAKMIWAVLKSHEVMLSYVKHHFHDHPSISAVMARHLAANFHKSDDNAGAKMTLLETKMKTLTARVDRAEAKLESTPNGRGRGGKKLKDRDDSDP